MRRRTLTGAAPGNQPLMKGDEVGVHLILPGVQMPCEPPRNEIVALRKALEDHHKA